MAREEALARGRSLIDLTESNPTRLGLAPSSSEITALLAHPEVGHYTPEPFGLPSARAAVVLELARAGIRVPLENVLLSASTSEAYGLLFKLLCDPEDEVLVPTPSYPLLDVLAQLERVRLVPYPLRDEGEWYLDHAALRAARTERTRAIVLVHPNNPTGSYVKREELARLAELGLPLLSDEVFSDYELEPNSGRAVSALDVADETLVFRMGGLSKSCALPQLKLAWTAFAGPAALEREARRRLEHITDAYLSPSAPVQLALPELLRAGERVRASILERITHNRDVLVRATKEQLVNGSRVEGGWYAVLRLPSVMNDEEWALALLQSCEVLVQPGYYYNFVDGGAYLVLSLLCEPATFAEGLRRIQCCVDENCA